MATLYEFSDVTSCNDCISWSNNHQIAICTDYSVKILSLVSTTETITPRLNCQQSSIPVEPDVFDIPRYASLQYQQLLNNLPKQLQKELIVDKIMNPFKFSEGQSSVTGYCAAAWSPVGAGIKESCILATLSHDFSLALYTQRTTAYKWFQVCNLSDMRLKKFPADDHLRTPSNFVSYRTWCYRHAYLAIAWSPVLYTDKENNIRYAVLAAGSKNGEIVIWKIYVASDTQYDCKLFNCFTVHPCQVNKLVWSKQTGTLAVGHLDGQVHVVQVNLTDPEVEPVSHSVHADSDLLRVSVMCFISNQQSGGEVLIVSKEDCVLGFHLDQQQGLLSQTHVISDSSFYGTGMCPVGDNCVLMSSLDTVLQKVQFSTEQGELKMSIDKIDPDAPETLNKQLMCQGITISPNQAIVASTYRPTPGYDHLDTLYKLPTKVHFKTVFSLGLGTDTQDYRLIALKLKEKADYFGTQLDLMETFRQTCVSTDPIVPINVEVKGDKIARDLKLNRYALMLKMNQLQSRINMNSEDYLLMAETVESLLKKSRLSPGSTLFEKQPEKSEDRTDLETLLSIKDSFLKTTLQIEMLHIQGCVERIKQLGLDTDNQNNIKVLKRMKAALEICHDKLLPVDVSSTVQQLENLIGKSDIAMETKCCICSCNLIQDGLQMKCDNGHSFEMCCQTLQPCEGIDYWKCTVCGSLCLSPEQLKELDWLGDWKGFCCLCEGKMSK